MTVLEKIKSFFKQPKATVKAAQTEPAAKAVEEKLPEKKADEVSQQ
jgi:hypothetical protein